MKLDKLLTDSIVEFCDEDTKIKDFAYSKVNSTGRDDKDDAFYVCNVGDVVSKMKRFRDCLPQVQPFYAVKCNPDAVVLKLLADLGANFDCASKGEINTVLDLGVSPDRIVFANPCKQTSHIKFAKTHNVRMMTFDNEVELHKIKQHFPNAELIIRIKVDDSKSLCKFGIKFGVDPCEAIDLLKVAWNLHLNVVGVSFHVGSGCYDASLFYEAVKAARMVFDQGTEVGFNFHLLDVGGGFPGTEIEDISFEDTARQLTVGFTEFFPPGCGIRIIAEPGRYFVASAYTLLSNVTSVREFAAEKGTNSSEGFMYYLNDGVYGSFNCILFDHQHPLAYPLKEADGSRLYKCSVWGPTCDSMDCISSSIMLPKMGVGDWMCFDNMGAYTIAAASRFNGFKAPTVVYVCHRNVKEITNSAIGEPVFASSCKKAASKAVAAEHLLPVTTVY